MAIERYGSKTDIAVKLILVFFVCLLSFSVGTFVGKKFSDNQHRLAQFEPSSQEREVASTEAATEHGENKASNGGALSDEEIAKLAEEFVSDEESAVAKSDETSHGETQSTEKTNSHTSPARSVAAADEHAAPASPVSKAPSHETPSPAAKTAAAPAAAAPTVGTPTAVTPPTSHSAPAAPAKPAAHTPAAVTAPAKAPASTSAAHSTEKSTESTTKSASTSSLAEKVAASAVGKYTVQVGSYPSEAEASKRADALKAEGFGAFYVRADVVDKKTNESKTWYRVSVGLFQTQKEADTYKADLMSRAKVSSALVQKITK